MGSEIILDGQKYPVRLDKAQVRTWHDHGMSFVGKKNTWRRVKTPNLVILHWTGGENSADTTYHTLLQRSLGVTFCISRSGDIYQFLDPVQYDPRDTDGEMGLRSISIEITNYGFRMPRQVIPSRGRVRPIDMEFIHGQKVPCARFFPIQIFSVAVLLKTLCSVLSIPLAFPREKDGSLALRLLRPEERRTFRGVIGHFHKTTNKFDPGFDLLRRLDPLEVRL